MKSIYCNYSISLLCELFGYTRQNFYKVRKVQLLRQEQSGIILDMIYEVRKDQPKIGTAKLRVLLDEKLSNLGIKLGRDRWYNLLRTHDLLIKQKKKYRPKMTDGNGQSIFPDIRKTLKLTTANQLWSADITYIELERGARKHCYATLVVDEYSHLIVGFHVAADMTAKQTLLALKSAVEQQGGVNNDFDYKLTFHSDRGGQFKSLDFQTYLQKSQIKQSMTQRGMSYENPVSERLNGILKNELLEQKTFKSLKQAKVAIQKAVIIYNTKRPHLSCEMKTPQEAHKTSGPLKKLWRPRKRKGHHT